MISKIFEYWSQKFKLFSYICVLNSRNFLKTIPTKWQTDEVTYIYLYIWSNNKIKFHGFTGNLKRIIFKNTHWKCYPYYFQPNFKFVFIFRASSFRILSYKHLHVFVVTESYTKNQKNSSFKTKTQFIAYMSNNPIRYTNRWIKVNKRVLKKLYSNKSLPHVNK